MTLEQLSHETFYNMGSYSQLIIDIVQETEDDIETMSVEEKGANVYLLQNILEVIDKSRTEDVTALMSLIKILSD